MMDAAEYERRHQRLAELAHWLRAREGHWIEARELEKIAGRLAWRTRVSECRTKLGMHIENKQERATLDDGTFAVLSSYRYLSQTPQGRDAGTFVSGQKTLFIL